MTEWSVRRTRQADDDGPGSTGKAADREFTIDDSLGYLVNRAARRLARDLADELRPLGVGIGQWAVLMFLWARDGMTQAELSRLVAIEPPTMVRTLDRMVRDGIVTRESDPQDGRLTRVHLTDRGRALRDELVPRAVAVNQAAEAALTTDEATTLRRALVKLIGSKGRPDNSMRSGRAISPTAPRRGARA
jgi:DNA-binding MarR family transcriptional regulator